MTPIRLCTVLETKAKVWFKSNYMEQSPFWEATRPQLLKKLPSFYKTRRFITAFTRARHLSLSCVTSIPSYNLSKIRFNIILTYSDSKFRPRAQFGSSAVYSVLFPLPYLLHFPTLYLTSSLICQNDEDEQPENLPNHILFPSSLINVVTITKALLIFLLHVLSDFAGLLQFHVYFEATFFSSRVFSDSIRNSLTKSFYYRQTRRLLYSLIPSHENAASLPHVCTLEFLHFIWRT
jgi:hypothetical protein